MRSCNVNRYVLGIENLSLNLSQKVLNYSGYLTHFSKKKGIDDLSYFLFNYSKYLAHFLALGIDFSKIGTKTVTIIQEIYYVYLSYI